jgi:hypothetical protein
MSKNEWTPCTNPPPRACAVRIRRMNSDGTVRDEKQGIWRPMKGRYEHKKGWQIAVIDTQDLWAPVKV